MVTLEMPPPSFSLFLAFSCGLYKVGRRAAVEAIMKDDGRVARRLAVGRRRNGKD